jgi:hypothetical protein
VETVERVVVDFGDEILLNEGNVIWRLRVALVLERHLIELVAKGDEFFGRDDLQILNSATIEPFFLSHQGLEELSIVADQQVLTLVTVHFVLMLLKHLLVSLIFGGFDLNRCLGSDSHS